METLRSVHEKKAKRRKKRHRSFASKSTVYWVIGKKK